MKTMTNCKTCERELPYKRLENGSEFLDLDRVTFLPFAAGIVHRDCPTYFQCPKGYGECENAQTCVYPGRC